MIGANRPTSDFRDLPRRPDLVVSVEMVVATAAMTHRKAQPEKRGDICLDPTARARARGPGPTGSCRFGSAHAAEQEGSERCRA